MKYNRSEFAGNIGFSSVIDSKFKTSSLSVRFITKLSSDKAADYAVGAGVLTSSNSEYKTYAELNKKMSSLYGAALSSSAKKRGDLQILSINSSWINSCYAIDGEDIDAEMLDIICGCVFAPNARGGSFDKESFDITKKDLLDKIESEINNKRGYALSKAAELAFRGEPAENSCYGTKESALKVTQESAYSAYEEMLRTAQVEIFYIAPKENSAVEERFRDEFARILRDSEKNEFRSISPLKNEVVTESEELPVNQCKMVMNFKTDSDDKYAVKLLSTVFGETPVSKLFMNVREKLSLCYYCASRYVSSKGALMVDSGVERSNLDKAKDEILRQLDEIRNGNISDEQLSSAMLSIDNSLTAVGDTPSSYIGWYFERFCDNKIVTPQEQLELYKAVTKERIIKAAQSVKLDSIYIMLNKEAEA